MKPAHLLLLALIATVADGCRELAARTLRPARQEAPPPLAGVTDPYGQAGALALVERKPQDYPDLHNVYRLSDSIVSGGEPLSEIALARIAGMGVRTILSVDGKVPDEETAARHGMRYVHIPIQYKGLSDDELLRVAKTYRELDGPFYVHCFHGRHRGPAVAAIGRLVRDGASREQALAEMRQWCGTSDKYTGLYELIATRSMPTASKTEAYPWDFPAAHVPSDFRAAMVGLQRHWDNLVLLRDREWRPHPEHPDLDPLNEAQKTLDLLAASRHADQSEDFGDWMDDSVAASRTLVGALKRGDRRGATKSLRVLKQSCASCHATYRNE